MKSLKDSLINNLLSYSIQKYASCVIEKFIINGGADVQNEVIRKLLCTKKYSIFNIYSDPLLISVLLEDQYGNFVIQKLLDCSNGEEHNNLLVSPLWSI